MINKPLEKILYHIFSLKFNKKVSSQYTELLKFIFKAIISQLSSTEIKIVIIFMVNIISNINYV